MDLVASYLQQQKGQQNNPFLLHLARSSLETSSDADSIVSAAVASMAAGAAKALRKSKARVEENVEGARAVT